MLWREAEEQYDLLGLLCVFTIWFKIIMRSLSREEDGLSLGWDEPISPAMEAEFRQVLQHLKELKTIRFPRSMWLDLIQGPVKGMVLSRPELADGSIV